MRRRALGAAALALAVAALMPAAASGYVIGGNPWPKMTITYYAATGDYAAPVRRAARVWNRANVGVRFARTSRSTADVVIVHGGSRCEGETTMGFAGWRDGASVVYLGAGCSKQLITLTAVHELGHVLGLDHERTRCARMNATFAPDGTPGRCRNRPVTYWLAHPLTSDDIRGARALYARY